MLSLSSECTVSVTVSSQTLYTTLRQSRNKTQPLSSALLARLPASRRPGHTAAAPRVASQSTHAWKSQATPPAPQLANETAAVPNWPYKIIFLFNRPTSKPFSNSCGLTNSSLIRFYDFTANTNQRSWFQITACRPDILDLRQFS
jgi:hypothetical protein